MNVSMVRHGTDNRANASHHAVPTTSTNASTHRASTSAIASGGTVACSNRYGHRGGTEESEHARGLYKKPPHEERRHITGTTARGIVIRAIATATTAGGNDSHGHGGGTETPRLATRIVG